MRRLPVYILIDTSGSMKGEPIEAVKVCLSDMFSTLKNDPYSLETVWVSVITFNKEAQVLFPLTELDKIVVPKISVPDDGPTHIGRALELLCNQYDAEVRNTNVEQKGDWRPLLFILTDGKPSDILHYNNMVEEVKLRKFGNIFACAAGMKAKKEPLLQLTSNVLESASIDAGTFKQFFQYVSVTITEGGKSVQMTPDIDNPPEEIEIQLDF
ncbi:MAG: VWA domain-containing protein [Bacteroidales bacterium]|nr:VWA domain-containing protein [Bacteroidales bacterium]